MSQANIVFDVRPREAAGKSGARAERRQGRVPAIIYGAGMPPEAVSVVAGDVMKALASDGLVSRLVGLRANGKVQTAIAADIQFHPVTDRPLHIDLVRVAKGEKARLEIPVRFVGEEESPGLKRGGSLNIVRRTVEVMAPIDAVPEELTCDLTGLDIGDNVKISSVTLPEDVTPTITDRDFTIATLVGRVAETAEPQAETDESEDTEDTSAEDPES